MVYYKGFKAINTSSFETTAGTLTFSTASAISDCEKDFFWMNYLSSLLPL